MCEYSLFHDNNVDGVRDDGQYSKPFIVINRVRQECALVPTVSSLVFSAMPIEAFNWGGCGHRTRSYGGIYKLQRLKGEAKVMIDIRDLLFADDYALCTSIRYAM